MIYYVVGSWHRPRNYHSHYLKWLMNYWLLINFPINHFSPLLNHMFFVFIVICWGLWGKSSASSFPPWPKLLPQESPDLWWQNDWLAQPPAGCWLHPRWGHAVLRCCLGFRLNDILILDGVVKTCCCRMFVKSEQVRKWCHSSGCPGLPSFILQLRC